MNQPTREEFEAFKQEIRQEVRQLKEQRTEEMKAINVNVASADVTTRLDELEQNQKALFDVMVKTVEDNVKDLRDDLKQDISNVQTVQSGHSKFFEEHGKRLAATATKEDLAILKTAQDARFDKLEATQEQILKLLQQKPGELTQQ